MINSKTSFLALIGSPVGHSLSPVMQNAALEHLGLNLIYIAIPCKENDFEIVINSLKKINCKGLNLTIPFKEKVMQYCDKISPAAKKIKAINTLRLNDNYEWEGTNTDVEGFIYPLKRINFSKKTGIVLGSGGAARSVIQGLINLKFSNIVIISRNEQAQRKLVRDFQGSSSLIKGLMNNDLEIIDLINSSDLIINTTPVGMKHIKNENLPFGLNLWKSLNSQTIVYDLIYNPLPTELIKYCNKKGCLTIDGSQMLVAQGAQSLKYWTNSKEIPFEIMMEAVKKHL